MGEWLKKFTLPVIIPLVIGGTASYVGVRVALATQSAQIDALSGKLTEWDQRITKQINTIDERQREHLKEAGHPVIEERVGSHERRITKLENHQ